MFTAVPLGLVVSQPDTLLSALRGDIDKQFCKSSETDQKLATDWCFLDSKLINNNWCVSQMCVCVSCHSGQQQLNTF